MQEVKRPKRPLIFYYVVMILVILLFNCIVAPYIAGKAISDVDYGTFMTMTENGEIGKVQLQRNQIIFTSKDESSIYRTGVMDDPGLVDRLHASGVAFTSEIVEETSPLASLLLSWLLPLGIFVLLGQFMSKKLMDKAGGGAGSMMFNMGKSNAKVYVKSSDGIRFSDVEGVDEAEENLQEIVDYLENPEKYREIGASMPKGVLLVGPPGTGKTMLAKAVAGEAPCPARNLWRCSSAWALPRCAICSARQRRKLPASSSSTKSTPSARSVAADSTAATTSVSRPSTSCSPRWTALTAAAASLSSPPPTAPSPLTRRLHVPAALTAACRLNCPTSRVVRRS